MNIYEEHNDNLSSYQDSFRNMKGHIHVLERSVSVDLQMEYFRTSKNYKRSIPRDYVVTDQECADLYAELVEQTVSEEPEYLSKYTIRNLLIKLASSRNPKAYTCLKQYVEQYPECPELLAKAKTIVVFDHHRQGEEVIRNTDLSYIEPYASSACEMIAEVLQYFDDDIHLSNTEADAIYAGILIDTNNFVSKTGVRTFEAAAYLRRCGAEVTRVRKLMRNDMNAYKARAEAIRHAEVYRGAFAISVCPADNIESPTVACAQAANELLNITGIKASFVLTEYNGKIYISARSIDEINVQRIMEDLGGGGHMNSAGAQLTGCTILEARRTIEHMLDEIMEGGIK